MSGDRGSQNGSREISDLVGVELTLAFTIWLLVTLACFFFVSVVLGIILVAAGAVGFGWFLVNAVRRADIED
jgi:hypothetical protein